MSAQMLSPADDKLMRTFSIDVTQLQHIKDVAAETAEGLRARDYPPILAILQLSYTCHLVAAYCQMDKTDLASIQAENRQVLDDVARFQFEDALRTSREPGAYDGAKVKLSS